MLSKFIRKLDEGKADISLIIGAICSPNDLKILAFYLAQPENLRQIGEAKRVSVAHNWFQVGCRIEYSFDRTSLAIDDHG